MHLPARSHSTPIALYHFGRLAMNYHSENSEPDSQPLLPQTRTIWFFIVATIVALALGVVRSAEQGGAIAAAIVVGGAFIAMFCLFSIIFFAVSYTLGATEKAVWQERTTSSPFAADSMPDKVELAKPTSDV